MKGVDGVRTAGTREAGRGSGPRRAAPSVNAAGGNPPPSASLRQRLRLAGQLTRRPVDTATGWAARPALHGSRTPLTRWNRRQLTDTPMAIRAAKAPTSQTRTGTFFNLLMTTSFYNRGRRCPGADACHRFMNRRARMVTRETPPAGLTRAGGGLIRLGPRRSSGIPASVRSSGTETPPPSASFAAVTRRGSAASAKAGTAWRWPAQASGAPPVARRRLHGPPSRRAVLTVVRLAGLG